MDASSADCFCSVRLRQLRSDLLAIEELTTRARSTERDLAGQHHGDARHDADHRQRETARPGGTIAHYRIFGRRIEVRAAVEREREPRIGIAKVVRRQIVSAHGRINSSSCNRLRRATTALVVTMRSAIPGSCEMPESSDRSNVARCVESWSL
jgi:hypothetical protein